MTDKELIKEKIERLLKDNKHNQHNDSIQESLDKASKCRLLYELKKFIDSLPEEPKCIYNRTLDERKKFCKYCSAFCTVRIKEESESEDLEKEIIKVWKDSDDNGNLSELGKFRVIAHHFTKWQRKKDQETIELAEDHAMLAGMNRMKEKMMKDAVEAEVFVDYNINFGYGSLAANIDLDEQHLKEGDKVKIIIVKED